MMPTVTMAVNRASRGGRSTRRSMTSDGIDRATTLIMKAITVPRATPFSHSASASGITPAALAYMGIPAAVATSTPTGLSDPA